jgi:putative tricarboxylic transport membrane protein
MAAIFGLVGFTLFKLGFEAAPLALGFVLGDLLEQKLRQALIISNGDPTTFLRSPLSACLLLVAVIALAMAVLPTIKRSRDEVFVENS